MMDHYLNVSLGQDFVALRSEDDFERMASRISTCKMGSTVVGERNGSIQQFFSIELFDGLDGSLSFGIGLCSDCHGLMPHLLLRPNDHMFVIGLNDSIIGFGIDTKTIRFSGELPSLFHCFCVDEKTHSLLAFHELGVDCFEFSGSRRWSISEDLVVASDVTIDAVLLEFADTEAIEVRIVDGFRRKHRA